MTSNHGWPRVAGGVRRKALGVAFLGLLVASGWLTHAVFAKTFVDVVPVTLRTGRIGLQMDPRAQVKMRGVVVGEVRDMRPDGAGALLELALDPTTVPAIPADVTALIMPTTLFGQKYVSLQVPPDASPESLSAGDLIERTDVPIEVGKVLADLHPLLTAVRPADLSTTLNAMATALEGRGGRLGDNLVRLDGYLKRLSPQVPGLVEDLRLLGRASDTYAGVMPEMGRLLRNQVTTGDTLVQKEQQLRALFSAVAGFSDTTRDFLEVNEDNIIRLGEVSAPTLALLDEYSPEYPCLLEGLASWLPQAEESYRGYTLHINLETLPYQPTGYGPADKPKYGAAHGVEEQPTCATLPDPPYSQANPAPLPDWADSRERDDGIAGSHGKYRTAPRFADAGAAVSTGWAGTRAEQRVVDALLAPVIGVPAGKVPDVATLLLGPVARGNQVSVQ
ncbi:MAG: MCE family protein [Actinomycetota bacterium]|nr:MCE family protein [Actinomycetota bacterium]